MTDVSSSISQSLIRTNLNNKSLQQTLSKFLSFKIQQNNNNNTKTSSYPQTSWKTYLYTLIPHILFLYISIFIPTMRNGELRDMYSNIIYSVVNFPSTLLCDMWGYEPSIIIASVIIACIVLNVLIWIGCMWILSHAIDYIKYARAILWICSQIILVASPFFVNMLVGFYNCSQTIDEKTLERLLFRYPGVNCSDSQNMVMIILAICSLIVLFGLIIVNRLVVSDMNPSDKVPLCCVYPVQIVALDVFNFIGVLLLFSIPFEYKIVADCLNIVMSLILVVVVVYFKTCYSRIDNSLLCGVAGARLGVSIGSLVSTVLKYETFYLQVIGIPVTFSLGLICFISCTIFMEIYQYALIRSARNLLLDGLDYSSDKRTIYSTIEMNCDRILQENNGLNVSTLSFYFNQFHRMKMKQLNEEMTEKDLIAVASRALLNKNLRNEQLLFYISLLIAYSGNEDNIISNLDKSIEILQNLTRHSKSFVKTTLILYKLLVLQELKLSFSSQISSSEFSEDGKMKLLKYNQEMLLSLHRDFWKELIEESPQFATIEKIANKIAELTIECNQTYEELVGHKRTKKILQMYAAYIESFHFDKVKADSLNEEASKLEKETRGRAGSLKRPRKRSQIAPSSAFLEVNESSDQISDNYFIERADEEIQKDLIFRNGIRSKPSESMRNSLFIVMITILFGVGLGGVLFSILIADTIRTSVINLNSACFTEKVGMSVIRNVRSMQNTIEFIVNQKNEWKSSFDGYPTETIKEYIEHYVERIENEKSTLNDLILLGQKDVFDASTFTAYGAGESKAFLPTISSNGFYSGPYETRRVSVNEFVNNLKSFLNHLEESFPKSQLLLLTDSNVTLSVNERAILTQQVLNSTYMNSIQDYNFMYYWSNIDNTFDILSTFCTNYVASSQAATTESLFQYQIYLITGGLALLPISILFIIIVLYRQYYLKRLVKTLKRETPRERIAKIYQNLCKQCNCDSSLDSSLFSKITKARYTLIISVILLILINPLCLGMFYNEINNNAVSALKTYYNIQAGARVTYFVQICGYYLSEMLTFYGLGQLKGKSTNFAHPFLRTSGSFDELSKVLLDQIDSLSSNYTDLIFGNINIPYDTPLIGIYPVMDKILKFGLASNCTEYFIANNLTNNVQNYYNYCIGVEKIMSEFVSTSSQVSEITKNFYKFQSTNYTSQDLSNLFFKHYITQARSYPLSNKLAAFMEEFARVSAEVSYLALLLCSLIGGLVSVVLSRLILSIMESNSNQYYYIKMLLNYLPVELIENNEKLKNLVLYNQYSNPVSDKLGSKSGSIAEIGEGSYSGVCSVINSSIDGSLIINSEGEVELINNPALNMLGLSTQDILGTSFFSIFEEGKIKETVQKSLKGLLQEFSGNEKGAHDSLETMCLRKNGTRFPTKVNLFTVKVAEKGALIVVTIKDITSEKKSQSLLEEEKKHSENLLQNILPETVAVRLKKGDTFIAEALDDVTIFFSDMVGFTKMSSGLAPVDLVRMLNTVINGFDDLTDKFELEKIKTIGDAYFAVGGVGNTQSDHPERTLEFAMETFSVIHNFNLRNPQTQINIRIGINTGSVVAGVIGTKKFAYDLWGDAVNTASRMESTSMPGRIQITRSTYERVYDLGFAFEERNIEVKGKGMTNCYLLNARHHRNPIPTLEELEKVVLDEDLSTIPERRNRGNSIIASHEKSKQDILLKSIELTD